MNDPLLAIDKLSALLTVAARTNTDSERASLYGACRWLIQDLETHCAERRLQLAENIERARWSLCAMLGYDIANGHGNERHHSWALAAIAEIRRKIVE